MKNMRIQLYATLACFLLTLVTTYGQGWKPYVEAGMNDCMANVSLFIIRTAYGPEAEKINLLAGLLQEAGLQGEIKGACGVEALGCLFGLKHYQSVIYGFSISGADRNISLSIRWMVKRWFWKRGSDRVKIGWNGWKVGHPLKKGRPAFLIFHRRIYICGI